MLAADTFICLLLIIYCQYSKHNRYRQLQVQFCNSISNRQAYVITMRSTAFYYAPESYKTFRAIVFVFKNIPVFMNDKRNFYCTGYCDYIYAFDTLGIQYFFASFFKLINYCCVPVGTN